MEVEGGTGSVAAPQTPHTPIRPPKHDLMIVEEVRMRQGVGGTL